MSSYRLNILFAEQDLATISKAHQRVVMIKHTAGSTDTPVAWASFRPWMNNTVDWEETFAIYASNTELMSGATINKLSDKMATTGVEYKFADGYFHNPTKVEGANANTYIVRNQEDHAPAITLGLAQSIVVNGEAFERNPINAVYVPFGQITTMTPIELVDVYLENSIKDSTVITHIQSVALPVEYGEGETTHTIKYNGTTGQFFMQN